MKNFLEKYIGFVILLGVAFLIMLLLVVSHEFRRYRHAKTALWDCFAGAATKCGYVDDTKEEILENIYSLNLSPEKARELILDAREEGNKYKLKLENKKSLSKNEEFILNSMSSRDNYFKRVLEVIDEMQNQDK